MSNKLPFDPPQDEPRDCLSCRQPSGLNWLADTEDPDNDWVLDIEDPPTKGLLLHAIRTKFADSKISCWFSVSIGAWVVTRNGFAPVESYTSEGHALIEAWNQRNWRT